MRRPARVAAGALACLAVLTLGLTAGCDDRRQVAVQPERPPEPTHAPAEWDTAVTWRPCPELPRQALSRALPAGVLPGFLSELVTGLAASVLTAGRRYECATLTVPQDWAAPDSGETFDLALARVRTVHQTDRVGSLVVNPGGPGASGVDAAAYLSLIPLAGGLPDAVSRRFDIVGFDPRGVGRSSPVECFSDADLDAQFGAEPDPVDQAEFDAQVTAAQRRGEECGNKHGAALSHYSTRQTAHDLDAIRAALGDDQLTYLGYSYGTLPGAVYAHLYPGNVRALVLDGAVDPARGGVAGDDAEDPQIEGGSGGQAAGFERAFDNFAAWCVATPGACPLGPDPRAAVTGAIESARRAPVTGADGRRASSGWVFWAVVSSLYVEDLWPQLGQAIADLESGDPAGVFRLADLYTGRDEDGAYPNMFDANTAINCADSATRPTVDQIRAAQASARDAYPLFGAPLAVMGLDCALWPGEPDPYPYGPAQGAPPILVIGTTGDPATPYESTARLAELLGTGVVLTYEGEGHTVYPRSDCVNEVVHAYLVDLTAPDPAGHTCT